MKTAKQSKRSATQSVTIHIPAPDDTPYFLSEEDFTAGFEANKVTFNGQELARFLCWAEGPALCFDRERKLFCIEGGEVSPVTLAESVRMVANRATQEEEADSELRAEWLNQVAQVIQGEAPNAPVPIEATAPKAPAPMESTPSKATTPEQRTAANDTAFIDSEDVLQAAIKKDGCRMVEVFNLPPAALGLAPDGGVRLYIDMERSDCVTQSEDLRLAEALRVYSVCKRVSLDGRGGEALEDFFNLAAEKLEVKP